MSQHLDEAMGLTHELCKGAFSLLDTIFAKWIGN